MKVEKKRRGEMAMLGGLDAWQERRNRTEVRLSARSDAQDGGGSSSKERIN